MPPRVDHFDHGDLFRQFLPQNGVPRAWGNYITWMNRAARQLGRTITASDLADLQQVEFLIDQVRAADSRPGAVVFIKNTLDEKNLRSTFRKYVQMVQSNYGGAFPENEAASAPEANDLRGDELPERTRQEVFRIIRDTALSRQVKKMHRFQCQICSTILQLEPGVPYAEAHHLKPLGQPHNGPDCLENLLCVCPNCHVFLDYNAIRIDIAKLRIVEGHRIGREFVDYHNRHCRGNSSQS